VEAPGQLPSLPPPLKSGPASWVTPLTTIALSRPPPSMVYRRELVSSWAAVKVRDESIDHSSSYSTGSNS